MHLPTLHYILGLVEVPFNSIGEGRRDNQREGVSLSEEEKGGEEEGESTPTYHLSSYSTLFAKTNSRKVTSQVLSCH